MSQPTAAELAAAIRAVPDYPSAGVVFRDITPLLVAPRLFRPAVEALGAGLAGEVDLVTGIEARGFILAAPVALALGVGFVPVRKQGRLPAATVSAGYSLEYGQATVEIHADAVRPGQRVVIVDDVLATGGTARAAAELVERLGGQVTGFRFLIELADLGGRSALPGSDVQALLRF